MKGQLKEKTESIARASLNPNANVTDLIASKTKSYCVKISQQKDQIAKLTAELQQVRQ